MSERYEWNSASDCPLEVVPPGTKLGMDEVDQDSYGLVIGDPWASAYVVEDAPDVLRAFARRIIALLDRACAQFPLPAT